MMNYKVLKEFTGVALQVEQVNRKGKGYQKIATKTLDVKNENYCGNILLDTIKWRN